MPALYPYQVTHEGVADLAAWLNREAITIYVSVPVLFRHFVGSLTAERFPCLRMIQLGSDLVTRRDLDLYREHFTSGTMLVVRLGTPYLSIGATFLFLVFALERLVNADRYGVALGAAARENFEGERVRNRIDRA